MHGVAARVAKSPDGRLARAHPSHRRLAGAGRQRLGLAQKLDHRAEALDRAGAQFERGLVGDELAAFAVVGVRQQRRHRHFDKIRIAIEHFAVRIGELRRFDNQMNKVGAGRIEAVEIEALEQRKLLQRHRALTPRAGLAHREAAIVVGERRLDMRRPFRHVVGGEHAAMALAAGVHDLLGAAEAVDRLGNESFRPRCARALDLRDAIATGALGVLDDARISGRQPFVGEQAAGRRHLVVGQIDRRRTRPVIAEQLRHRGDGGVGTLQQWITVLRVTDRRRQHVSDAHGAVIAQQHHPGLERAGHAGGKEPGARNEVEAFAAVMRDRRAGRRDALTADHFRPAAAHVEENDRDVAARPVEMRLDHLERERRGDGRVERVAAAFKDAHAHGSRYPMGRSHDAERALDLRTRGEGIGIDIGHERSRRFAGHYRPSACSSVALRPACCMRRAPRIQTDRL